MQSNQTPSTTHHKKLPNSAKKGDLPQTDESLAALDIRSERTSPQLLRPPPV